MGYEPQRLKAPDGTAMVLITEAHYRALIEAVEDADDLAAAVAALQEMRDPEAGPVPASVSREIRSGIHPLTAWRKYRSLTQAALALAAEVPQSVIARIESGKGYGRPETRRALAKALAAPLWSLEQDDTA